MLFLIGLCLALAFAWYGGQFVKRHAGMLYWLAAALSVLMVAVIHSGADAGLPGFLSDWLLPLLSNCALATAMFAVVMYMAVLPRGGTAVKRLLPIRGELSILASILTLGHNIAYGRTYFLMLLTQPERLKGNLLWAAVISVVLVIIMVPLFITSFPVVRRKMRAKAWKKLQRMAYGFYALVYIHVMLLAVELNNLGNILVYSGVFLTYGILRIRKALVKKHPAAARRICAGLAIPAAALVCLLCIPEPKPARREPVEPVTYVDGIYFGEAEGYVGTTQVAVTVSDGRLQSVIVVSSEDDASYVEDAKTMIPAVIDAQHTYVDTITGATYTSQAILEAIDNALAGE